MIENNHDGAPPGAAFQVDYAPESEGSPLRRGPSAFQRFIQRALAFRRFLRRAEVRVWAGPALRGVTLILALSSVAMLGHAADQKAMFGIPITKEAASLPVSRSAPSSNAARAASGRGAEAPHTGQGQPRSEVGPTSACPVPPPCSPQPAAGSGKAVLADGRIVLNEATLDDFKRLPGIGQRRAEALMALREKLGGFKKLSDLLRVKGIGHKSLKKFEAVAVVTRPPESASVE